MTPYVGNEPFIFGSYAHVDQEIVYPIFQKMLRRGYRLWFDKAIRGQSYYGEVIAERINESKYFIAFITKNYMTSDYCKKELEFADRKKIKILPILLENVELLPWIDLTLGSTQGILKHKYSSENAFYDAIFASENINDFLANDPKKLLSEIESAKIINNCVSAEKILTAKITDRVFPVVETAYNKSFGYLPIVDDDKRCLGIFDHEIWSKILVDCLAENKKIAFDNELTFQDIEEYVSLDAKRIREVVFLNQESTVLDLKMKTSESFKKSHKGVGVFLITENGSPDEPLLGLLTPTGLLGRKI